MSPTESQIRARKKYREKQEYLQARVSPEEKLAIAEHVNATNESLSDFIRRAIKETMERDNATKNLDFKWHRFSTDSRWQIFVIEVIIPAKP